VAKVEEIGRVERFTECRHDRDLIAPGGVEPSRGTVPVALRDINIRSEQQLHDLKLTSVRRKHDGS
jgi:hypothetical protein